VQNVPSFRRGLSDGIQEMEMFLREHFRHHFSAKMCIEAKQVYAPYYVPTGTYGKDSEVTD
jgi:hypothetical protein